VPTVERHPLKRLLDAGVNVTTNSDDPPSFGGYLGENYTVIADALGLRADDDTRQLATNSLRSC
jgi:adenosine deaminase